LRGLAKGSGGGTTADATFGWRPFSHANGARVVILISAT